MRRYVEAELQPYAAEWESAEWFPNEVFERMGELGFLGLTVPEAHGGQGADYWATVVLYEELMRAGSAGLASAVASHTDIATPPILRLGTDAQIEQYLSPAVEGKRVACFAFTEPDAGPDLADVNTWAKRDGSDWLITGVKTFVTNGVRADCCTLAARTAEPSGDERAGGISIFLVDTASPGVKVERQAGKVGMCAVDTADLVLTDVRVPEEALLGGEGNGLELARELRGERLIASVQAVALAQRQLDLAMDYAAQRRVFGQAVADFQVQRHRFAELSTRIEACRRLVYDCCDSWNLGTASELDIAQCKLASAGMANWVVDEALQVYGGYGYSKEFEVERAWRDMRLLRVSGGSDESQREIIGQALGL